LRIGVVGTGNMGSALVKGWLRSSESDVALVLYDQDSERTDVLRGISPERIEVAPTVRDTAARSDVLFVSVKPQELESVLAGVRDESSDGKVVSTAAGVTLPRIRAALGSGPAVFRIMPNLAVSVGEGVIALAPEEKTAPGATEAVKAVLRPLGVVELVPEQYLDVVTGLTGSGPGMLALALEGLEDGAVHCGLPRALARPFALQMALGAARMMIEEGVSPAELKDRVASPAGTTIFGVAELEDHGVRGAFLRAVGAAVDRGQSL